MCHVPQRSEQGHCGSGCSPLSRLAVTLLCTAGEVMEHEQQHLCVCYHCRKSSSPPSLLPPSVSKFGSVPLSVAQCCPFLEHLQVSEHQSVGWGVGGREGVIWVLKLMTLILFFFPAS